MARIILHIDMDAFFPSVEAVQNPRLRGKPVVVGADPRAGRGVVSSASYEARKYGIRSGMPISRAWRLCPEAVYLPVNIRLYRTVSARIMQILRRYAGRFEQVGLDEAFLDVSQRVRDVEEAENLARQIKEEVRQKEGLTCSIGIGPNKLAAKIASGWQKPDGLTIVRPAEVKRFLAPLPVRRIPGIGRKTARRLARLGIHTIGELARADPARLIDQFGVWGGYFWQMAQGQDESPVKERWVIKSLGRELTFEQDTSDVDLILGTLNKLCADVYAKVVQKDYHFRTVTVKVRYENFETHTHARTLSLPTQRLEDIRRLSHKLIQPFLGGDKKVRLVGVRVSGLISDRRQKTLARVSKLLSPTCSHRPDNA